MCWPEGGRREGFEAPAFWSAAGSAAPRRFGQRQPHSRANEPQRRGDAEWIRGCFLGRCDVIGRCETTNGFESGVDAALCHRTPQSHGADSQRWLSRFGLRLHTGSAGEYGAWVKPRPPPWMGATERIGRKHCGGRGSTRAVNNRAPHLYKGRRIATPTAQPAK